MSIINTTVSPVKRAIIRPVKSAYAWMKRHPIAAVLLPLSTSQALRSALQPLPHTSHCLANKSICFAPTFNTGGAFGLPASSSLWTTTFTTLSLLSLAALFITAKAKSAKLAIALIFSGWLGNCFERWRYGGVTDYLKIGNWPTFNIADTALVLGAGLLLGEAASRPSVGLRAPLPITGQAPFSSFDETHLPNTVAQALLYYLTIYNLLPLHALLPPKLGYLACVITFFTSLSLSLVRNFRHRGERMF